MAKLVSNVCGAQGMATASSCNLGVGTLPILIHNKALPFRVKIEEELGCTVSVALLLALSTARYSSNGALVSSNLWRILLVPIMYALCIAAQRRFDHKSTKLFVATIAPAHLTQHVRALIILTNPALSPLKCSKPSRASHLASGSSV